MANRYRLTRIDPNDLGDSSQQHKKASQHSDVNHTYPYESGHHSVSRQSSNRGWMWAFFGVIVVLLIIGTAVWMSGVSGSLAHLNYTAQQNSQALSHQSAQLTGIQLELHQISQQLSQISNQISIFFGNMMQAISSGKL